jgi:hypothetical protein
MNKLITISLLISFTIFGCKKDEISEPLTTSFQNGVLCMNEGLFQQNNAGLSYYSIDSGKVTKNLFSEINGRGLGDTANDMISYVFNGKPYIAIAVDVSSQIEIIDGLTLNSIKQIPVFNGTSARQPRRIKQHNNFLYSINFDGTVSVISLNDHTIIKNIEVGLNPDNAIIKGEELFVVNSGGLNAPNYDNTISIINLNSQSLTNTFTSDINCGSIIKDEQNELYVISRGNYSDIDPKLLRINSSNEVIETFNINIGPSTYYNNNIYFYNNFDNAIHKLNTTNETISNEKFIDCGNFETVYNIQINPENEDIYIVDANGYVNSSIVHCYNFAGQYKYQFTSGLNTGKLIFNK